MPGFCKTTLVLAAIAASSIRFDGARAASSLQLSNPDGGEVRALVIGIDDYQHVRKLKGATADARDIEFEPEGDGRPRCDGPDQRSGRPVERPARDQRGWSSVPRPTISSSCRLPATERRSPSASRARSPTAWRTSSCCPASSPRRQVRSNASSAANSITSSGNSSCAAPRSFSLRIRATAAVWCATSIRVRRK